MVYEYKKSEINCVFWFPDYPEKIDGYYSISENGELRVLLIDGRDILKERFKSYKASDDIILEDVILGERKDWTYFGGELLRIKDKPSKLTLIKNSITRRKDYSWIYEVIPYVVIDGAHFNSLEEITFNELSIKYDYLPDWIESRQDVEAEIEDATVSLVFDGKEAYIKVKFNSEKSLKECLEIEDSIGQFLNFVSACDFGLLEFKGKSSKGEVDIIKQFTVGYLPRAEFIFTFKDIQNDFGKFLSKWMELRKESKRKDEPSKIEIITNIHISLDSPRHNEVENIYTDFLICVFALEAYHSIRFEISMFKKDEKDVWNSLKSEFKEIIDKHKHSFSEEGIENSLKNKIKYLEEKSLRQKLKKDILENFLGIEVGKKILLEKDVEKDVKEAIKNFVGETVGYRNKLVHELDIPPIEKLTELIPKLKAILKACILKDLGLSIYH